MKDLLKLGRVVGTPAALALLEEAKVGYTTLLERHASHDWGDVYPEDAETNEAAISDERFPGRVLSTYQITPKDVVYVLTECDRSATTILLPAEY